MYDETAAHKLRQNLRQILDRIAADGSRQMILRNGVPVAALVAPTDLHALEKADGSRMEFFERMNEAKLREIRWLKDGLDGARYEAKSKD